MVTRGQLTDQHGQVAALMRHWCNVVIGGMCKLAACLSIMSRHCTAGESYLASSCFLGAMLNYIFGTSVLYPHTSTMVIGTVLYATHFCL